MAYKGLDLSGKVALVTGGNSGSGLGWAGARAQAGAAVCIWGTNEGKNAAALKRLLGHGGKALAIRCDVSDEEAGDRCFAETVKTLGRVDAFFANAGVSGRGGASGGFAQMSTAEWRRGMSGNLDGAFWRLREAARHMGGGAGGGDPPMPEAALRGEAFKGKVLPRVPLRRWGVGDDFGGVAVYLASDASRYHTGDTFVIDGGYLIS